MNFKKESKIFSFRNFHTLLHSDASKAPDSGVHVSHRNHCDGCDERTSEVLTQLLTYFTIRSDLQKEKQGLERNRFNSSVQITCFF